MTEPGTPPLPPRLKGQIVLPGYRLWGTLLIALIPVLALFNLFGESWEEHRVVTGPYAIEIRYPSRFRYTELNHISVRVQNTHALPITAVVEFDPQLLEAFSEVAFLPAEDKAYEVKLQSIAPQAEALLRVTIQGERYGRHHGEVRITAAGVTAAIPLEIWVFP